MAERTCALCDNAVDDKYRPFCSKRCADVDLNRWLSGRYAVPVVDEDNARERPPEAANDSDDRPAPHGAGHRPTKPL